jgi:hypothetical protein
MASLESGALAWSKGLVPVHKVLDVLGMSDKIFLADFRGTFIMRPMIAPRFRLRLPINALLDLDPQTRGAVLMVAIAVERRKA